MDSVSCLAYPAQKQFNKLLSIGSLFSIMCGSTCEFLARVDGDSVLSDSAHIWGYGCRDLLTVFYAFQYFLPLGQNSAVAVYVDNTTALAFLRNQGGTSSADFEPDGSWSSALGGAPFHLFSASVHLGAHQCVGEFFFHLNPILGYEWILKLSGFQQLRRRWPVSSDLLATSLTHCCLPYFSPFHNSNALGTEVFLQPWDEWQAYAFPPYAFVPAIL